MRILVAIILFFSLSLSSKVVQAQKDNYGKLRSGDLLFQDLDCGPLCDAIEQVTKSYGGRHFSHIGLVSIEADSIYIIEAIGSKVQRTALSVFVQRSKNEILLGRVKKGYKKIALTAVEVARQKIGIPYDDAFVYDNGKYYCSELLYDAFKEANQNKDFFLLRPMTFKQPNSDTFFPVWVQYYQELKMPIPEGWAGINPGGISLSPNLVMYFYKK
ncbi:MAG: YiiX/YebB-like N1pC/P60 family cysteine hydrolase [Bacteroidota bacterium]